MVRRTTRKPAEARLKAPDSGVTVRMYRQGHGDCFLLAFPRNGGGDPVYMMIDCGYKPGSQISKKATATNVVKDIKAATGGRLDVVVVTHEHQDHVNALGKFKDFEIGVVWLAWTEDPKDPDANELRRRHKDQLLGLLGARNQLQGLALGGNEGAAATQARLDELLMLELGGEDEIDKVAGSPLWLGFGASGGTDPSKSQNKRAMETIKERAGRRIDYILPHDRIMEVPEAEGVRVFALGPPKTEDLLKDEDPRGDASFPGHELAGANSLSFFAAAGEDPSSDPGMPFAVEYGISKADAFDVVPFDRGDPAEFMALSGFFREHYGDGPVEDDDYQVATNAQWRRIDEEWLHAAESFALKLNRGVNNTSLVLAFELTGTGKVLLFAGDAQNGNWNSWDDGHWLDGDKKITPKDLLGRTVLYKVGHHGSHNATLKGGRTSEYPSLGWMGLGKYADEFTAMIPANRKWAMKKAKWNHPLPAIKHALEEKASGRVLQLDTGLPEQPGDVPDQEWLVFMERTKNTTDLYIEYQVPDAF